MMKELQISDETYKLLQQLASEEFIPVSPNQWIEEYIQRHDRSRHVHRGQVAREPCHRLNCFEKDDDTTHL